MQNKINKPIKETRPFDGIRRSVKTANVVVEKIEVFHLKSSVFKMAMVSVLALAASFSLSSVGGTISYFNDVEQTIGNFLQADPLSFKVEVASSTSVQVDMLSGGAIVTPVMTPDEDSEPIQYFVKANITGGDATLCNSIQVLGTWPFPYNGNLSVLTTATSTSIGAWTLTFSLPDVSQFSNKSCTIDLVYEGWNADSEYGKGYRDTQKISLTFFVPEIVQPAQALKAPETETELKTEPEQVGEALPKEETPAIVPEEQAAETPPAPAEQVSEPVVETPPQVETPPPADVPSEPTA